MANEDANVQVELAEKVNQSINWRKSALIIAVSLWLAVACGVAGGRVLRQYYFTPEAAVLAAYDSVEIYAKETVNNGVIEFILSVDENGAHWIHVAQIESKSFLGIKTWESETGTGIAVDDYLSANKKSDNYVGVSASSVIDKNTYVHFGVTGNSAIYNVLVNQIEPAVLGVTKNGHTFWVWYIINDEFGLNTEELTFKN
jgi:hypothetical protein